VESEQSAVLNTVQSTDELSLCVNSAVHGVGSGVDLGPWTVPRGIVAAWIGWHGAIVVREQIILSI